VLSSGTGKKEREKQIWEEYFSGLSLVGLISLDEIIDLRTSITIDELTKNGIKFWMLTSDNLENALSIAFKQGIVKLNTNPMVLQGNTDTEV